MIPLFKIGSQAVFGARDCLRLIWAGLGAVRDSF